MTQYFRLAWGLILIIGCGGGSTIVGIECGAQGTRVEVGEETFCTYAGFAPEQLIGCPPELPNAFLLSAGTVCTARDALDDDTAPAAVCAALGGCNVPPMICMDDTTMCLGDSQCCESEKLGSFCVADAGECVEECATDDISCPFPCEQDCPANEVPCAEGCCAGAVLTQAIDDATGVGEIDIAVSSDGVAHVVYLDGQDVVHAQSDNGWQAEIIESGNFSQIGIAVDTDAAPHVAYLDAGSDPEAPTGRYAVRNAGTWEHEDTPFGPRGIVTVAGRGAQVLAAGAVWEKDGDGWRKHGPDFPVGEGRAITTDASGALHVAAGNVNSLRHFRLRRSGWDNQQIGGLGDAAQPVQIAVGACGALYVSSRGCFNGDASVCIRDRSTGEFEGTGVVRNAIGYAIGADSDGYARVALRTVGNEETSWKTEYAQWDGEAFQFTTVAQESADSSSAIAMVIDQDGNAHIAFIDAGVQYAKVSTSGN